MTNWRRQSSSKLATVPVVQSMPNQGVQTEQGSGAAPVPPTFTVVQLRRKMGRGPCPLTLER